MATKLFHAKIKDRNVKLKGSLFKEKCSHHLLTLKNFQTCTSFFLLLTTKEDIAKNVGNLTVDGSHRLL